MPVYPFIYTDSKAKWGRPPYVRETRDGDIGHRTMICNTVDEEEALEQCPPLGTPYSVKHPGCLLFSKEPRYLGGMPRAGGVGGVTAVDLEYATPSRGRLPPPQLSTRFTILKVANETVTQYSDQRAFSGQGPGQDVDLPIENGNGAGRDVGMIEATVYTYFPATGPTFNWTRMIRLARESNTNAAAIQLPPLLGTTYIINLAAEQARYRGFEHNVVNGLMEIQHQLMLASDWYVHWIVEGSTGDYGTGRNIQSQIYTPADMDGLW